MTSTTAAPPAPVVPPVPGLGVLVAQLAQVAEVLGREAESGAWSGVPVVVAPPLVEELVRVRDLIGAVVTAGVSVVHASGALPGGHVSTKRWLQQATGLSGPSAVAQLARVRSLRDFPLTRIAALSGVLSEDKVRAITMGMEAAVEVLGPAERVAAIAGVEADLVEFARGASVERVRRKISRLRFALDSQGADARALVAFDGQELRFTPVADGVQVSGWLTGETAAAVMTCLDQIVGAWFRSGGAGVGAGSRAVTRAASRAHLNALALGELAARMLNAGGVGGKHGARPHLVVTLDLADYRAGLGGDLLLPGHGDLLVARSSTDRIRCDADVTTVITTAAPARELPEPVAPVVVDDDYKRLAQWLREESREVLFVGRSQRTAPPRLRRALEVRDGGCVAPGCETDPSRCQAHHVQHWTHGGGTDLDNLALVCTRHHHLIHEGGWALLPDPDLRPGTTGYWNLTPPDRQRQP